MSKRIIIGAGLFIIFGLTVAFVVMEQSPRRELGDIKIGVITPLTGASAIVGRENLNGIELAIEKLNSEGGINGRKIKLIVKDDQYNTKETIIQYQQLVSVEGIRYLITPTYGGFLALAKQTERDNVILVDSIDTSEELANISQNNIAVGVYDESLGYAIADYLNDKGISHIGVLVNTGDPFPILVESALKDRYKGKIQRETYTFDDQDFRTTLAKLADNNHIVVIGWEETGRIIKQAKELQLQAQFIGIDTFATENFRKNTANNYEGLIFSFWQGLENNEKFVEFTTAYQQKFAKEPDNVLFAVVGYDAMMVLAEGLKKCGDDVACVSRTLRNDIKNFKGATGEITIDPDGITRSIRETMHKYENGKIVELK